MSSVVPNILDFYRQDVPRGLINYIEPVTWEIGSTPDFVISPVNTTPAEVWIIKELELYDFAIAFTETNSGSGLIDITYPDLTTQSFDLYSIVSKDQFYILAKDSITIGSNTLHKIQFDPAIILDAGNTENTFTLKKNTNVSAISSGSLKISAKGWKLYSTNY